MFIFNKLELFMEIRNQNARIQQQFPIITSFFCRIYYLSKLKRNNIHQQRYEIYINNYKTSMPFIFLMIFAFIANSTLFSVSPDFKVSFQNSHDELAHIYYIQELNSHGMNYIHAYANLQKNLLEQHRGVGFLQGYTTYQEIYSAYTNFNKVYFKTPTAKIPLQNFLNEQIEYIQEMAQQFPKDLYWQTVYAYLEQCRYTYRGYLQRIHQESRFDLYIGFSQFYYLTSIGDFQQLFPAFNLMELFMADRSCTAYIQKEGDRLIISHSTFNAYYFMLRIVKSYHFPTRDPRVGSQIIDFTSRPGDLNSKDDFYVLSSGLVVMETSLLIIGNKNFKELNPKSVPCWLRVTVACNLARNGQEWVDYFSKYHSGTHNNQWLIVDKSQIKANKNIVIFLEEAFSLIKVTDMTERLNKVGFLASYNVAYDHQVYQKLDYRQPQTYQTDIRAQILLKYYPKMKTLQDMKYWLLMNEQEDVRQGLAPRSDLYQQIASPYGLIDCKILTPESEKDNYYWMISGPSTSNGRFPPFTWDTFPNISYEGMPNTYNFTWQKVPIDIEKSKLLKHLVIQE